MLKRVLRDQKADGSWMLNPPARDRHATFDAVFIAEATRRRPRPSAARRWRRPATWALSCRNADGGFGHFPGSPSDADAVYFQVGTLVMAGCAEAGGPAAGGRAATGLGAFVSGEVSHLHETCAGNLSCLRS